MSDAGSERARFDRVVAGLDPAMVVVTATVGSESDGCLVGFHSQCSIDPPRYAIWMSVANRTTALVVRAGVVAVHALSADQHDLAELFGGTSADDADGVDKLASVRWSPGPDEVPVLGDAAACFVGRVTATHEVGGDHLCVVLEPLSVPASAPFEPLRMAQVEDVEPGHPA